MILGTWREGLAALRENGARLDNGSYQPVQVTNNPVECQGIKLALVMVKSWQTGRAAHQLADCLAADGLAVTLQNGLGNDTLLSSTLGPQRVARGVISLGATLLAPGVVSSGGEGNVILEQHSHITALKRYCA